MRSAASGMMLCAAVVIGGCAESPSHQQPHQPSAVPRSDRPAETAPAPRAAESTNSRVEQLFADPRLDPIRDKVPLVLRAGTVTPALLANEERPTPAEKQAIKVWMSVREQAQQIQLEQRGPPSQRLVRTRQQVTQAILQLYSGELTYGQFAKRIQVLDSEYQSAARQMRQ